NGTVIDHIPAGKALAVLRLLGNPHEKGFRVALVMNVSSKKMGKKDIVKVEGVELSDDQVQRLALVAPQATLNYVRSYQVVAKKNASPPNIVVGLLRCANPTCITVKQREPVYSTFTISSQAPLTYVCRYCGRELSEQEISSQVQ
ncbi:MAG: aspartate carbamoyltransferase regulatory subunit, partial [Thermoprotei archaeon]